jgi:hypothetical protein
MNIFTKISCDSCIVSIFDGKTVTGYNTSLVDLEDWSVFDSFPENVGWYLEQPAFHSMMAKDGKWRLIDCRGHISPWFKDKSKLEAWITR